MKQTTSSVPLKENAIQRMAYFLFLILVAYQAAIGELEWAVINLGVALVFDPFDPTVKFKDRPSYQKVWLYVHAGLSLAGFLYLVFTKTI
jgi:hypothetical protein